MKHIDRHSKLRRFDLPDHALPIAQATMNNRRIFSEEDDLEENPFTTAAIKYGNRNKIRARYRPLSKLDSKFDKEKAKRILKLLNLKTEDDEFHALDFQLNSWQQIENQNALRIARGDHKGMMITAPTGFGKTACFMGGTIQKLIDGNHDRVIFVYPSRALLQDQLSRVLEIVHQVNSSPEFNTSLSAGLWYGQQPYYKSQIFDEDKYDFVTSSVGEDHPILQVTNHWNEELDDRRFRIQRKTHGYKVTHPETDVSFPQKDFVLNKESIKDKNIGPEIILTTLESLELFGMKPHYSILSKADMIVFDEIHQYTGLRGAHAANIIDNTKSILEEEDEAALFIGSSATVETPERFGRQIFGLEDDEDIVTIDPEDNDTVESEEDIEQAFVPEAVREKGRPDRQHYYFMLTPEGGPGVASQYIQHAMMVGHSLSRDAENQTHDQMLSFIQSRSQIHSLTTQLRNADQDQELWKLHRSIDQEEDWDVLAKATGHQFYENSLEITPIHSQSTTTLDDLATADIIQSTSFLEVGIDIGDLKYISQYRPPQSISSFKQRAGRAGRKPGMDAYTFVLLSQYGGDENFYYRAERFLDRDITTPLEPDNRIVIWIHNLFQAHYETLNHFNPRGGWHKNKKRFLKKFFENELEWTRFSQFLLETNTEFEKLFDTSIPVTDGFIENEHYHNPVQKVEGELADLDQGMSNRMENIREYASVDTTEMLMKDSGANYVLDAIRDEIDRVFTAFVGLTDGETADDLDEITPLDIDDFRANLYESDAKTVSERIDALSEARVFLESTRPLLETEVSNSKDLPSREKISNINQALEDLEDLYETGEIEEFTLKKKRIYYLKNCISEIKEFKQGSFAPHGSLYYVKNLIRAAYYFYKCVNVGVEERVGSELPDDEGREEDTRIWYVPPNYFNDSGLYYKLKSPHPDRDPQDKSIDSILSQYAPFNEEYVDNEGTIQVFQPRVIREDGKSKIDFSETTGNEHKGVKIPDRIELDLVQDQSGSEGRSILAYSDHRFKILEDRTDDCPGGKSHLQFGKIYSQPTIKTEVDELDLGEIGGFHDVCVGDVDAKAWIESVEVEIQPRGFNGSNFYKPEDAETKTKTLPTTETKFGYVLETRGVKWDLSEFIEEIRSGEYNVLDSLSDFHPEKDEEELVNIALNTAAHYLTLLISDVSGVNAQLLLYSIDWDNDTIYVFEQTEGGQGIVDHFEDNLRRNPGKVLKSSYDLIHNPQIISEYLLEDSEFVEKLLTKTTSDAPFDDEKDEQDKLREIIRGHIVSQRGITFTPSINRIEEEVISLLRNLEGLHDERNITRRQIYELKSELASYRIDGISWEDALEKIQDKDKFDVGSEIDEGIEKETIKAVLWSPDVDACKANLDLPNTIANTAGTDEKSFICLRALQKHIISPAEKNEIEQLIRRDAPWARSTDDGVLFLEF